VGRDGTVLKTSDGGANWSSNNQGTDYVFYGIYFPEETIGYMIGGYYYGNDYFVFKTEDAGESWNIVSSGSAYDVNALYFIDANTGFIALGSYAKTILKTTDGGYTWDEIESTAGNSFLSIHFANDLEGYAVGMIRLDLFPEVGGLSFGQQMEVIPGVRPGCHFLTIINPFFSRHPQPATWLGGIKSSKHKMVDCHGMTSILAHTDTMI